MGQTVYTVTEKDFERLLTIARLFALAHPYPESKP